MFPFPFGRICDRSLEGKQHNSNVFPIVGHSEVFKTAIVIHFNFLLVGHFVLQGHQEGFFTIFILSFV